MAGFDWDKFKEELPPILTRAVAAKMVPAFTAGSLANLDSKGEGPERLLIGGKVCYPRDAFIAWLRTRIRPTRSGWEKIKS